MKAKEEDDSGRVACRDAVNKGGISHDGAQCQELKAMKEYMPLEFRMSEGGARNKENSYRVGFYQGNVTDNTFIQTDSAIVQTDSLERQSDDTFRQADNTFRQADNTFRQADNTFRQADNSVRASKRGGIKLGTGDARTRHKTSPKQLVVLERVSQSVLKPDKSLRQKLSSELGMTQRQVQIWFQNRRAKLKKMREMEGGVVRNRNKREKRIDKGKTEELYSALDTSAIAHPPVNYDTLKEYTTSYYHMDQPYYAGSSLYPNPAGYTYYIPRDRAEAYDQHGRYPYYSKPAGVPTEEYLEEISKNPNFGVGHPKYYQNNVQHPGNPFYPDEHYRN